MAAAKILNPTYPQTDEQVKERIIEHAGEDSNVAIPNGYPESYVGLYFNEDTEEYQAVYSKDKMITKVMTEDSCSYLEAVEWLEFNTWQVGMSDFSMPIYINT